MASWQGTTQDAFVSAHVVSAYSLVSMVRHGLPFLAPGASVIALTYIGSQRVRGGGVEFPGAFFFSRLGMMRCCLRSLPPDDHGRAAAAAAAAAAAVAAAVLVVVIRSSRRGNGGSSGSIHGSGSSMTISIGSIGSTTNT